MQNKEDPYAQYAADKNDPYAQYVSNDDEKNKPQESYFDLPKSVGLGLAQLYNRGPQSYGSMENTFNVKKLFEQQFPNQPHIPTPNAEEVKDSLPQIDVEGLRDTLGRTGKENIADQLIQGLIKHSPELYGLKQVVTEASPLLSKAGSKIGEKASGLVEKYNPDAYAAIQNAHDVKLKGAQDIFENVGKQVKEKGISVVPVDENLISQIEEIGPKTKGFKNLVNKAKKGDYEDLRKIQTELFHLGNKRKASILPSDHDIGDMMFDLRDEVNDSIANHFKANYYPELEQLLHKGVNEYRELKELYNTNPTISKLVNPKLREVPPTNKPLQKNSIPVNRLKENVPEIERKLKFERKHKIAKGAVKTGLGLEGLHELYKILK